MHEQTLKAPLFEELQRKQPDLYKRVLNVFDEVVAIRRDLRQHPELSFQETRTSKIVAKYLRSLGYQVQEGVGKTGVVGVLKGKSEGPVIGLRADMDALPMMDSIDKPYRSKVENMAHTCGHDAHTSILLGVAKIFSEKQLEKGTLKLIFQPAEEIGKGASSMIADDVLENPKVCAMAGLHVHPTVHTGEFSMTASEYSCAAVDHVEIEISGKGGHAAYPHTTIDPVMIAAQVLVTLQQIVSRKVDPLDSVVLSFGKIHGGTKGNIIPDKVQISGTLRTLKPSTRIEVKKQIETAAVHTAKALGGDLHLHFNEGPPAIKIDKKMQALLEETIISLFTRDAIKYQFPSMGGEDFSFYSYKVPSVFFRLGTNSSQDTSYSNHHPLFDVDEKAFLYGMAVLSQFVQNYVDRY